MAGVSREVQEASKQEYLGRDKTEWFAKGWVSRRNKSEKGKKGWIGGESRGILGVAEAGAGAEGG